jgi:hypothetical protein
LNSIISLFAPILAHQWPITSMKKAQSLYKTQGNKAKAQELEQLLRRMK